MGLNKLSPNRQGSSAKRYAKVTSHEAQQRAQSHQPDNRPPATNTRSRSHVVIESDESSVDQQLRPPRFKHGDCVVAFNKKGIRVHGTVRWVGRNVASRKLTVTVVGIETVSIQLCCVL